MRDIEDDAMAEGAVEVHCPWCGEPHTLEPDGSGGASQEYVEDCPVCCNPWLVKVRFTTSGPADVTLERAQ